VKSLRNGANHGFLGPGKGPAERVRLFGSGTNAEKKTAAAAIGGRLPASKSKMEIPGYSECQCYSYAGRFVRHSDQHRFARAKG
jgi:hypothetical protein